jgi:site-specific recombinase XerD
LRRVNVEDLDLEDRSIRVTGKGSKMRIVPITSTAADVARQYLSIRHASRGPLLVSYTGRRLSSNGVYAVMCKRAGIRPHLLRHACATHMLQNGAGIRTIQELLGHADLKATQIYTHLDKTDLAAVVERRHPRAQKG